MNFVKYETARKLVILLALSNHKVLCWPFMTINY